MNIRAIQPCFDAHTLNFLYLLVSYMFESATQFAKLTDKAVDQIAALKHKRILKGCHKKKQIYDSNIESCKRITTAHEACKVIITGSF